MLEAVIDLFLFCVYSLTAIAIYLFIKFYYNRRSINKTLGLIISISLAWLSILILLTSGPSPHYTPSESDIQFSKDQQLVGYSILIPNLIIAVSLPSIKAYPQLEVLLGRITEDPSIIIWATLKRITTGKIEITYYKGLEKLGKLSNDFNSIINLGIWEIGKKRQFNNFQEAVDFLRTTHKTYDLNFVNKGKLHSEYLKMLNSETN